MSDVREIIRCSEDCAYFVEKYIRILDYRTQSALPFRLWPEQRRLLRIWQENPRTITLKSRQLGITWLALARMLWKCMLHPYEHGLVIAIDERFAVELVGRIKFMYRHLPEFLQVPVRRPESMGRIEWPELDSVIEAETSSTTAGTGGTYSIILLDEWAKHKFADEVWASVRPSVDQCELMIVSTAYGVGNLFHQQYVQAQRGENTLVPVFLPWHAKPDRDLAWYEEQARDLGRKVKQEYPETPEEAFLTSGSPVFDPAYLPEVCDEPLRDVPEELRIEGMKVYALPEPGYAYAFGWDSAQGFAGGDFCAGVGFCKQTGEQVLSFRAKISPEQFARVIDTVARIYRVAVHGVERNNHGYATVLKLKEMGTPNLYAQRDPLTGYRDPRRVGWLTTSATKPLLVDTFDELLRAGLVRIRCAELREELLVYQDEGNGKYGAPSGYHDDLAVAAFLAAIMLREVKTWKAGDIRFGSTLDVAPIG